MRTKSDVVIKRCGMEDVEIVGKFYDGEIWHMDESGTNYPKWRYGDYPSVQSVRAAIGKGTQYACLLDGHLCGAFVLDENPGGAYERGNWSVALHEGEYLIIHALAVSHELAGQGIGAAAVTYCMNYAKAAGYKAVRIDVVPSNLPARGLYEKMGFTFAGEADLNRKIAAIPTFVLYEWNG